MTNGPFSPLLTRATIQSNLYSLYLYIFVSFSEQSIFHWKIHVTRMKGVLLTLSSGAFLFWVPRVQTDGYSYCPSYDENDNHNKWWEQTKTCWSAWICLSNIHNNGFCCTFFYRYWLSWERQSSELMYICIYMRKCSGVWDFPER